MYFLIITAIATVVVLWAILWPHSSLLCPVARKGDRSLRQIALTFDDGPHPEYTPVVLDVLAEFGIKTTFFCLGRQVERYPELTRRIHEEGHLIGSHSYDHSFRFYFSGTRATYRQMVKAGRSIEAVTGYFPKFYRPPVGIKTPPQCFASGSLSLCIVGWSRRAFEGSYSRLNEAKVQKLAASLKNGDIVLLHDGRISPGGKELVLPGYKEELAQRLREFLKRVIDGGYQMVRVDELLHEEASMPSPPIDVERKWNLRQLFRSLLSEYSDPRSLGLSVGAGVFVGCTPLWGLHAILALLVALKFRLNKVAALIGTHISNPLFAPFVLYGSVEIGWFVQHGDWLDLDMTALRSSDFFNYADSLFFSWVLGSLILGAVLALLLGSLTYALFLSRRKPA